MPLGVNGRCWSSRDKSHASLSCVDAWLCGDTRRDEQKENRQALLGQAVRPSTWLLVSAFFFFAASEERKYVIAIGENKTMVAIGPIHQRRMFPVVCVTTIVKKSIHPKKVNTRDKFFFHI